MILERNSLKMRWLFIGCIFLICILMSGCGSPEGATPAETNEVSPTVMESEAVVKSEAVEESEVKDEPVSTVQTEAAVEEPNKVLVAYFTRLPNTESGDDLDAVVQGGGPYGAIGENFANADMDAISSASVTVLDEGVKGNVQTVAEWIAEYTGGELFSIETVEKYPLDYDTLIDLGGEEQQADFRPELSTHIENIEDYSVIYLGYPNWYHDMPMALYSFLEEYDMEGKTIVPFTTSAGSGLANTISTIAGMQPEAVVVEDGLALRMGDVKNSKEVVTEWIDGLNVE